MGLFKSFGNRKKTRRCWNHSEARGQTRSGRRRPLHAEALEERTLLSHVPLNLGAGNEPFVAVDPFNPDNVVVGANRLGAVFSTNGGLSFPTTSVPGTGGGQAAYRGDPGLAIDSQGRVFFSYLVSDAVVPADLDIAVSNSNFTAQNFAANQLVISLPDNAGDTGDDDDKELIAADWFPSSPFRDNVYVAWRELNNEDLLFSRSTNSGGVFSAPAAIANAGAFDFNTISAADPEVGPNGEVYVGFWTGNSNSVAAACGTDWTGTTGEIRVVKSTDGGVNFGASTLISAAQGTAGQDATLLDHTAGDCTQNLPNQTFKIVSRTQLDIEADPYRAGFVYAVWATDPDGTNVGDGANVMYSRSTDGGTTWSDPNDVTIPAVVLNDDGGALSQHMPSIGVDETGKLTVIWYDERLSTNVNDPTLAVFATVSLDGGQTFSSNFPLSGSGFDPDSGGANTFIGDYIQVAAADGAGYGTWTQTDAVGANQIRFLKYSLLAPFKDPFEQNNTQGNATVLGSEQQITLRDLTIHNAFDEDWFKITAPDTGKLIINAFFEHALGNIDIRVRDGNGNIIRSSTSGSDNEQIIVPVVSQQMYFLEVFGVGGDTNVYDLEIENFAAPVPDAVVLDPTDDSGWSNSDNVTSEDEARILVEADLADFAQEGIDILDPTEVANQEPGAAVEVFVNGGSVGYATPIAGTGDTLFEYTFAPGELSTTFIPVGGGGGLNFVKAAVRIFDGQQDGECNPNPADGRTQLSEPLLLTLDMTAPAECTADLLASSDTGTFDDDNVTNKDQPAFDGRAEANGKIRVYADNLLVGEGFAGSDPSDGRAGDGLGKWEITIEPLDDGIYTILVRVEDLAGNVSSDHCQTLKIEIDTTQPNMPWLDLLAVDDSGRSNEDDVTNVATPRLDSVVADPNGPDGHLFPSTNVMYRIFDRFDTQPEAQVFDSAPLHDNGAFTDTVDLRRIAEVVGTENDGLHNLKLEAEDRAGNLSHDFLLDVLLDRVAPPVTIIDIDPAASDTGVPLDPSSLVDRITSHTATGFFGRAEADAVVRLYVNASANTTIDTPADFSLTVAVPLDGNLAFPDGQWNTAFIRDLNGAPFPRDGLRTVLVEAEDVAGNINRVDDQSGDLHQRLPIFIDTQGPQIYDPAGPAQAIQIGGWANYDLFQPKASDPTAGPTPLVDSLVINVRDLPDRVAGFLHQALAEAVAEEPGHYLLVGDHNGVIPILDVVVTNAAGAAGAQATATVELQFARPLPDDRFTLTISDWLVDPVGNALDGENNAIEPHDPPEFPSGDAVAGGDFVARFTVDSRAEIGVYSSRSVYVDTNGNFTFDPQNADFTNRDVVYRFGTDLDYLFAGNFASPGGSADGFDKLAAYGRVGDDFRWLVDLTNDGVADVSHVDPGMVGGLAVEMNGLPVAGNFGPGDDDEVGLFNGVDWLFDTTGDFEVNKRATALPLPNGEPFTGFPIVGDLDGDGIEDLGAWRDDRFLLSLSSQPGGGYGGATPVQATTIIPFGFSGARERPVAADVDGDGIDDLGLWVPDRSGVLPGEAGEWYFLLSDFNAKGIVDRCVPGSAPLEQIVDFTPVPFGPDIFAQYGDQFAMPIVGNFDPPGPGQPAGQSLSTVGLYDPSTAGFHLKNSNASGGGADVAFSFGPANARLVPLVGDWNGDGTETAGLYDPATAGFHLKNSNRTGGGADLVLRFGPRGGAGWQPITGDWDGDGIDTVGLYDPARAGFHLKNSNRSGGGADLVLRFGPRGGAGWRPITGDWDGDGIDTLGLYDPTNGGFHLKNSNQPGPPDVRPFRFGPRGSAGWHPLTGDWNADGADSIGLYDPAAGGFHLKNVNAQHPAGADLAFRFGPRGNRGWIPLAGDWNGPETPSPAPAAAVGFEATSRQATRLSAWAETFATWVDSSHDESQAARHPTPAEIDAYFAEL